MNRFTQYTIANAPAGSKAALEGTQAAFNFVPNLQTFMAESPALLNSYSAVWDIFTKQTSFTAIELQVVLLTVSYEHQCQYCVAGHSTLSQMFKMDNATLTALRDGTPIANARLEALRAFTRQVVIERGFVNAEDLDTFFKAGYTKANVFDVITGVALKLMSNYTNHITETPLDDFMKSNAWIHPTKRTAKMPEKAMAMSM
jgi:uncharacterized peroxidase-related enzyme